jgi:nicotinate (nicotinamide) nucleotide adenylyltransferase
MAFKALIMGGAFDPFHQAHFFIASSMRTLGICSEVLVMPTFRNQFDKVMTNPSHRARMVKIHLSEYGFDSDSSLSAIRLNTFEIDNQLTGGTHDVLKAFFKKQKQYAPENTGYIIGVDQANSITLWKHWQELLKTYRFVVVNRKKDGLDIEPKSLWFLDEPHCFVEIPIADGTLDMSSSQIRHMCATGHRKNIRGEGLVSAGVYEYICEKGLYV